MYWMNMMRGLQKNAIALIEQDKLICLDSQCKAITRTQRQSCTDTPKRSILSRSQENQSTSNESGTIDAKRESERDSLEKSEY